MGEVRLLHRLPASVSTQQIAMQQINSSPGMQGPKERIITHLQTPAVEAQKKAEPPVARLGLDEALVKGCNYSVHTGVGRKEKKK